MHVSIHYSCRNILRWTRWAAEQLAALILQLDAFNPLQRKRAQQDDVIKKKHQPGLIQWKVMWKCDISVCFMFSFEEDYSLLINGFICHHQLSLHWSSGLSSYVPKVSHDYLLTAFCHIFTLINTTGPLSLWISRVFTKTVFMSKIHIKRLKKNTSCFDPFFF